MFACYSYQKISCVIPLYTPMTYELYSKILSGIGAHCAKANQLERQILYLIKNGPNKSTKTFREVIVKKSFDMMMHSMRAWNLAFCQLRNNNCLYNQKKIASICGLVNDLMVQYSELRNICITCE
jgi:hypothetical protein